MGSPSKVLDDGSIVWRLVLDNRVVNDNLVAIWLWETRGYDSYDKFLLEYVPLPENMYPLYNDWMGWCNLSVC